MKRRINVDSGRPLESRAHYSRALRVDDIVLQSGTTAIDRDGNVIGNDIATQIDAILDLARTTMALAEGQFNNIVRARLYVTGASNLTLAHDAFATKLDTIRPATTVIPVSRLARPTQLIEIELEAVDQAVTHTDSISLTHTNPTDRRHAHAIRIDNRVLVGGIHGRGETIASQVTIALDQVRDLVERAGAQFEDLAALRLFMTNLSEAESVLDCVRASLGGIKPVVSVLGIPAFDNSTVKFMVDAEAIRDSNTDRRATAHPSLAGFSQTVAIDDHIFLSNIVPLNAKGAIENPRNWGAQRDFCTAQLATTLESVGSTLDDVIVRRFYTRADSEMNRDYGDGPAWFANSRPTALGCRIVGHPHHDAVLSLEAHAIRGAGAAIEWRKI